jgi:hypothetical protein
MIHESDGEADWLIVLWNKVKIVLNYGVCSKKSTITPFSKKETLQRDRFLGTILKRGIECEKIFQKFF